MIKKVILLSLLAMPAAQYGLTINWRNFYCGSAGVSLTALLISLNIIEANNKEFKEKQNDIEYEKIKNALLALNVHLREYYGYERSGNKVNTENIIHETFIDIPRDISDKDLTQANSYNQKITDLKKEPKTSLGMFNECVFPFLILLGFGSLVTLSGSIGC